MLNGEIEAVEAILQAAETYGYGNLIAWLKWKWARKLIADGIDIHTAIEATEVAPYPPDKDVLKAMKENSR